MYYSSPGAVKIGTSIHHSMRFDCDADEKENESESARWSGQQFKHLLSFLLRVYSQNPFRFAYC